MAVHPGAGIHDGTLYDWIRAYLGKRAVRNGFVASPVHRLDRETSGVVLCAKRRPAMVALSEAFATGHVHKRYLALVKGIPAKERGVIDAPLPDLARPGHAQRASTEYVVIERFAQASLLACAPRTGRTHQIRRHLAGVGHPLAGDARYGEAAFNQLTREKYGLSRLFLHAESLRAPHPRDGQLWSVEAPLAPELQTVLARLRVERS